MSKDNTLKYHYFYKITNNINGHFYYGVHNTNNINDGYMGSGTRLHYAYKKYGIENFSKEILKYFESSDDAFQYESEMVTEDLIFNPDCYNLVKGGIGWNNEGLVAVKDNITGKCIHVSKNDPRYLNGELKGITYGLVTCKDKDNNNVLQIDKHHIRLNDRTYTYIHKGKSLYKDEKGNTYFLCTDDERIKKLNLVSFSKGMRTVRDKNNNYFYVDVNDERIKTGELYSLWKDRKHTEETKQKLKDTFKKNHHQQGVKNSQYGTCWVYKYVDENIQNKKIKKEDKELYLLNGWYSGRKIKI